MPIDAASAVEAMVEAWRYTGEPRYASLAGVAYEWFGGHNRAGVRLYDPETGSCHDGLTRDGYNPNCGAEAALAHQQALLSLVRSGLATLPDRVPVERPAADRLVRSRPRIERTGRGTTGGERTSGHGPISSDRGGSRISLDRSGASRISRAGGATRRVSLSRDGATLTGTGATPTGLTPTSHVMPLPPVTPIPPPASASTGTAVSTATADSVPPEQVDAECSTAVAAERPGTVRTPDRASARSAAIPARPVVGTSSTARPKSRSRGTEGHNDAR
jgi:hypothetical protein